MRSYQLSFMAGLAAGYVLGARAGRERYEQLKELTRTAAQHPAVQQAAGTVQAQATGLAGGATKRVGAQLRQQASAARQKMTGAMPGRAPGGPEESAG